LKIYVADAVAFLYYLLDKLPPAADHVFRAAERGEALIYLPTIAAAELYYLFERKSWMSKWRELVSRIQDLPGFAFYPFDEEILLALETVPLRELHDKIIVATAKVLKAEALLTKDKAITKSKEVPTIWK